MARKQVIKGVNKAELIEMLKACGFAPTRLEGVFQMGDKYAYISAEMKGLIFKYQAHVSNTAPVFPPVKLAIGR